MALVAHYKLDGNALDSVGGYHGTWNGTASYVTGKIGQAGSFNGSSTISFPNVPDIRPVKEVSVSLWFSTTIINDNDYLILVGRDNSNGYALRIAGNALYGWVGSSGVGVGISANTTYHAVLTYKSGVGSRLYLNGGLVSSGGNIGDIPYNEIYGGPAIGGHGSVLYYFNGWIDDVKIYDHNLSVKEIKEINKAKILHYKFNELEEYTTNLWTNHTTPMWLSAYNGPYYGFGANTDLQQVAYNSDTIETGSAVTKVSRITGGTTQVDYVYWGIGCDPNTTRTISFWYFGTYGTQITPYNNDGNEAIYYLDSNGNWQGGNQFQPVPVVANKWQKIVLKVVANANGGTMTWNILHSDNASVSLSNMEYWLFTGLQVELKDHATPFTVGTRNAVITDSSGYDNHGTLSINGPQWKEDGKIGKGYVNFTIQNAFVPYCDSTIFRKTPLSISTWVKSSAVGTYSGLVCISYAFRFTLESNGLIYFYSWNSDNGYISVPTSGYSNLYDNNWHHVAMTHTGTHVVIYVDNVIRGSSNVHTTSWAWTNGVYIGVDPNNSGTSLIGAMDDTRIYASILNASDVTELYQTKASIDNNGGLTVASITELGPKFKNSSLAQVDYSRWILGSVGGQSGFSPLSQGTQYMITKPNPVGVNDIVWFGVSNGVSADNCGWNPAFHSPIDRTKKYRFSCWIRKENVGTCAAWFGLYSSNGTHHALDLNGGAGNNNPYFFAGGIILNKWILFIGYIWPEGTANTSTITGGLYNTDGSLYLPAQLEFKWPSGTTSAGMRTYMYYSTNKDEYQYWYRPRVDLCDGTEPPLGDLLACRENPVLLTNTEAQGLVTEYTMNEISGTTILDRKNNYNATMINSPSIVPGIKGNALFFNNSIEPQKYLSTNIGTTIRAISVWFKHKVADPSGFYGIVTGEGGWYLGLANATGAYSDESICWHNGSGLLMYVRNGQGAYLDDKWHHAVVSFGGNNNFWIDGVLQNVTYGSGSNSTDGSRVLNAVEIGSYYGYGLNTSFIGEIGDVRFYNRNLIQEDVNQLRLGQFALESSGNLIVNDVYVDGPKQGLVADYQFDINKPDLTLNLSSGMTKDNLNRVWKVSGTSWQEQAYSSQSYNNGCYISFRVGSTGGDWMMGLSLNPTAHASYNFGFAWYRDLGADNSIYEYYGSQAGGVGGHINFNIHDFLEISYWDGIVTYWINGTAHRSVNVGTGLTFYLDSSFSANMTVYEVYDIYFGPTAPDFHIQTFYSNGTFIPPANVTSVEALIIAGGGGGGMDMGGGGGAGGFIYNANIPVASLSSYPIVIGNGGTGAPAAGTDGQPAGHQYTISATSGGNSTFAGLTAIGGGYGGSSVHTYTPNYGNGGAGGSGGGASGYANDGSWDGSGAGTTGQGWRGGNSGGAYYSGGGGGAGGAGADGQNRPDGGVGIRYTSLSAFYWSGGGGGSAYSGTLNGGNGGLGGGGGGAVGSGGAGGLGLNNGQAGTAGLNESWANVPGGNAGANTGGGGGGGSHYNANNKGGNGGSGIVIIKYKKPVVNNVGFNNGIPYGGLSLSQGPYNKKALSFNGINQYIDSQIKQSDLGQTFTFSTWVYPTAENNHRGLIGDHGGAAQGMGFLQYDGTGRYCSWGDGTTWRGGTRFNIPLNTWTHIVWELKAGIGGFQRVYRNNILIINELVSTSFVPYGNIIIGRGYLGADRYWAGGASDIRIYNRILSSKDKETLYNTKPKNMYIEEDGIINASLLIQ